MSGFNSDISVNENIEFGSFSKSFLSPFTLSSFLQKILSGDSNKKSHVNEIKFSSA